MKPLILIFIAISFGAFCFAQGDDIEKPSRPFPYVSHITYFGVADSDNKLITSNAVVTYFKKWHKAYFSTDALGLSYIKNDESREKGITTSEATGYGMIIEVFMAGYDPHARKSFNQLYDYALAHCTATEKIPISSPNLMGWKQYKSIFKKDESDSAVDGDLDIAYALLLAHEQWGDDGKYNYLACAKKTLEAIKNEEIDIPNLKIQRGNADYYYKTSYGHNVIRLSDFMPSHFRAFSRWSNNPLWGQLLTANYKRYTSIQDSCSRQFGLFPDYVYEPKMGDFSLITDAVSKDTIDSEGLNDGGGAKNFRGQFYGYNSCRIPWRLTLDYLLNGDAMALNIIRKLNVGIKNYTETNGCLLTNILPLTDERSDEKHKAKIIADAGDESADLNIIGPLCVAAMIDRDSTWRNQLSHLLLDDDSRFRCNNDKRKKAKKRDYYENTIRLICLIIISRNYWQP